MPKKLSITILISFILTSTALSLCAQSNQKFSVTVSNNYSANLITEPQLENQQGRYGFGVELYYHFGVQNDFIHTAIGIAYSRVGYSRKFIWEDSTPEREDQYGKFPIQYTMWDDVHYISFPFKAIINASKNWHISASLSLDYPIGSGYFRERRSADDAVIDLNKEVFDSTKAYPWNSNIGAGMQIGRNIKINEKCTLIIEANFKVYTLLAFRNNDYFPHEEYERPYSLGITTGVLF